MQKRNCEAALSDLRAVVVATPRNAEAHHAIAICETELGHPDRATASFQRVANLQPSSWEAWNNLGANLIIVNQPERALAPFRKATALNPKSDSGWFNLGATLLKLGKSQEAFRALDRARRLVPKDVEVTKAWQDAAARSQQEAAGLIKLGQYQKAKDLLWLVRGPLENSSLWNNLLGYSEFKLNQYEPALNHLQKALTLEPSNEDFVLDLGEFLIHYQAHAASTAIFEVAAKKFSSSKRVQLMLAVAYILSDRRSEAVTLLNHLIQVNPDYEPAYSALGECHEKAKDWTALIELGKKLQVEKANAATGWYLEGVGLLNIGIEDLSSAAPAVAALKQALLLDRSSSRAHFMLAKAYQREKKYDLAIVELEETVRWDPLHESAHYNLGLLYQRAGKKDLANREFDIHKRIKERDRNIKLLVQTRAR
ncbi:MAG: tetratricopeptide repeat protein [Acidobacteria bacterium]|nr:tetratricopeptide repeat protein [Acidobacteriota bacterium]